MFDVNWNLDGFLKDLQTDANRTEGLSLEAIEELGHEILDDAKERCPVATGRLKRSGRVRVRPGRTARREVVTIVFGGKSAPYAVPVHFDPNANHPQGEHRFLEKAVNAKAGPGKLEAAVSRKFKVR